MTTERRSPRSVDIDLFPTKRILKLINSEDAQVTGVIASAIPDIAAAVDLAVETIRSGGRVLYVGAGTSGRIAILDAAECPATFGVSPKMIQAVIAGGPRAFAKAAEGSEDDRDKPVADLKLKKLSKRDAVIGISASGRTPYTLAALEYAKGIDCKTVAIVCAPDSPMARVAGMAICTAVGPEIIAGSTRMKAGTSQKLILNMISTATMIRLGTTYSNWMINVAMTNQKLRERGIQILRDILGVNAKEAARLADKSGNNLKIAVIMGTLACSRNEAEKRLAAADGNLRQVLRHAGSGSE